MPEETQQASQEESTIIESSEVNVEDQKSVDEMLSNVQGDNFKPRRLREMTSIKKTLDAAPTYNPKTFRDQFAMHNNKLYVYMDSAWIPIGATAGLWTLLYSLELNEAGYPTYDSGEIGDYDILHIIARVKHDEATNFSPSIRFNDTGGGGRDYSFQSTSGEDKIALTGSDVFDSSHYAFYDLKVSNPDGYPKIVTGTISVYEQSNYTQDPSAAIKVVTGAWDSTDRATSVQFLWDPNNGAAGFQAGTTFMILGINH